MTTNKRADIVITPRKGGLALRDKYSYNVIFDKLGEGDKGFKIKKKG